MLARARRGLRGLCNRRDTKGLALSTEDAQEATAASSSTTLLLRQTWIALLSSKANARGRSFSLLRSRPSIETWQMREMDEARQTAGRLELLDFPPDRCWHGNAFGHVLPARFQHTLTWISNLLFASRGGSEMTDHLARQFNGVLRL
jgi:hypothetical protein